MKSVKLKVSLIANLIAVVCLIILGVVTFIFVKQAIFHEVVNAEINVRGILKRTCNYP